MNNLRTKLLLSSIVSNHFREVAQKSSGLSGTELSQYAEVLAANSLSYIIENGHKMYKIYTIPKRSGGHRIIAHPSKDLKAFQRALVDLLSSKIKEHDAAYAYRKNVSIRDNAIVHSQNEYLLKMDFLNFFNSIDKMLIKAAFKNHGLKIAKSDFDILKSIIFWSPTKSKRGKFILSVGAPSSPMLSNLVLYQFDEAMESICRSLEVTYSRYADDIFFSTDKPNTLKDIPDFVKYFLNMIYGDKLRVNAAKTKFTSKAHNRHVTGIVINNECKISLGRAKKRYIKSLVFKSSKGHLCIDDMQKLQGLLAYAKHIEPMFIARLKRKFGDSLIIELQTGSWRG
ncbi:retron St85 family RNA-directed DNA polymerase [Shewanella algae]|uniref:retron St85 family RNA-directed DNA polymerase n=1 Tax=Shewanella algae TaxID=38313 RepID=UPI0031F54D94